MAIENGMVKQNLKMYLDKHGYIHVHPVRSLTQALQQKVKNFWI